MLTGNTYVATQANHQVCILKLYHGARRVMLAEAEAILSQSTKTHELETT